MSSNVLESFTATTRVSKTPVTTNSPHPPSIAGIIAVLAPVVAASLALLVHRLIPDGRLPTMSWLDKLPGWKHPYPILLDILIGLSILVAFAHVLCRPIRPLVRYYSPLFAAGLTIVCLWDFVTGKMGWLQQPFFPSPDEVLGGLIEDRDILLTSLHHSSLLLFTGYMVGVCVGFISGVVIGWFPLGRYWGMPVMKIVGPIPATVLVIVVMTISTSAFVGGVVLIAYAVWFPMTMLTASGIANVRVSYLDVARTLGANRRYLILHVAIPSAYRMFFWASLWDC